METTKGQKNVVVRQITRAIRVGIHLATRKFLREIGEKLQVEMGKFLWQFEICSAGIFFV